MELHELRCPNCGGKLDIRPGSDMCQCPYCGTQMVISRGSSEGGGRTDPTRFFLLFCSKGMQTQHAIRDEVRLDIAYRNDATSADPRPLGITATSGGVPIKSGFKIRNTGTGTVQISSSGGRIVMTKDRKVKLSINGVPMGTDSTELHYGDLVSVDRVIFRVQPMPGDRSRRPRSKERCRARARRLFQSIFSLAPHATRSVLIVSMYLSPFAATTLAANCLR